MKLVWSDPLPPGPDCPYRHVTAETPFGPFRLTWTDWKAQPNYGFSDYGFDYFPWSRDGGYSSSEENWCDDWRTLEEAKAAAQAELDRRLQLCSSREETLERLLRQMMASAFPTIYQPTMKAAWDAARAFLDPP